MKGVVLISHGEFAKGLADTATFFFGDDIPQLAYCCLHQEDDFDEFGLRIGEKIQEVDTGEGVIVLADLFGGSPCNQAMRYVNENVDLLAGVNLLMLIETLTSRMGDVDVDTLISNGQQGVVNVKTMLAASMLYDEDE